MVDSYSDMLLVPFAKYLKKYGELELSDLGSSVLIPEVRFHFDSILFRSKRLSWSVDKSWEFIAAITIVKKEDFAFNHIPLFQHLKGIECEITRKGFLKKRFQIISNPLLIYLQQEIPEIIIDDPLAEILNQDKILHGLFSIIKPDNLAIRIFSQPIEADNLTQYCHEFRNLFFNPTEIIWNICIEKYLGSIVSKRKYITTLDSIIEALDIISIHIQRVTQIVEKRV